MKIPDYLSESLETVFMDKILIFFDADPDPMENFWSGINVQDPQHCR